MRSLIRLAKSVVNQFLSPLCLQELQLSGGWKHQQISSWKGDLFSKSSIARQRFFGSSTARVSTPNSTHTDKNSTAHIEGSRHNPDIHPAMSSPVDDSKSWADIITQHTQATKDHLTPEIELRLITRECPLWHENTDQCPFTDPFWAFYWPGGQALTRFILDHPELIKGRTVLDVGSGCGASAIAACMTGASRVLANDIDPGKWTSCTIHKKKKK